MAEELELELSYEGEESDDYEEEVDFGHSEDEIHAVESHEAEKSVRPDKAGASGERPRKEEEGEEEEEKDRGRKEREQKENQEEDTREGKAREEAAEGEAEEHNTREEERLEEMEARKTPSESVDRHPEREKMTEDQGTTPVSDERQGHHEDRKSYATRGQWGGRGPARHQVAKAFAHPRYQQRMNGMEGNGPGMRGFREPIPRPPMGQGPFPPAFAPSGMMVGGPTQQHVASSVGFPSSVGMAAAPQMRPGFGRPGAGGGMMDVMSLQQRQQQQMLLMQQQLAMEQQLRMENASMPTMEFLPRNGPMPIPPLGGVRPAAGYERASPSKPRMQQRVGPGFTADNGRPRGVQRFDQGLRNGHGRGTGGMKRPPPPPPRPEPPPTTKRAVSTGRVPEAHVTKPKISNEADDVAKTIEGNKDAPSKEKLGDTEDVEARKKREEEERQRKLATIRALREEQAAKNRALAEQRKRKIEELNLAKQEAEEAKKRKAQELAVSRVTQGEAAQKKIAEERELAAKILAEKEAQLAELRRQLEEARRQSQPKKDSEEIRSDDLEQLANSKNGDVGTKVDGSKSAD